MTKSFSKKDRIYVPKLALFSKTTDNWGLNIQVKVTLSGRNGGFIKRMTVYFVKKIG